MPAEVTMWTVYDHPREYPDKWVLRAWDMPGGRRETVETAETLEEIRAKVPPSLLRLPRNEEDDPAVYETWV